MSNLPEDSIEVNDITKWKTEINEVFSVDQVLGWLDSVVKVFPEASRKNMKTATRLFLGVLGDLPYDQEMKDNALLFLERLPEVHSRFVNSHPNVPSSKEYLSRVKRLLREFYKFKSDPSAYKAPASVVRSHSKKPKNGNGAAKASVAEGEASSINSCLALPGGKVFACRIPENMTMNDVDRVSFWLKSQARDFDPECVQIAKAKEPPKFKS